MDKKYNIPPIGDSSPNRKEARIITNKLSAVMEKNGIELPSMFYEAHEVSVKNALDTLSSKHKEDVRALKTALTLQDSCPDHRDDCTCYEIAVAAFDSTLKDLGIEL